MSSISRSMGQRPDGQPTLGYVKADLVARSAPPLGSPALDLVLTDIASGQTARLPVFAPDSIHVIEAFAKAGELFPIPLRGIAFDNHSLFTEDALVRWCREHRIEITRVSRAEIFLGCPLEFSDVRG
ncbi:hypothetical protein J7E62_05930 [Variovorax paradoxus]|nr:hypothetical protein [Variovorax paradoxus]